MTGKTSPTDTTPAKGTTSKTAAGKPTADDGDPYAGTAPAAPPKQTDKPKT